MTTVQFTALLFRKVSFQVTQFSFSRIQEGTFLTCLVPFAGYGSIKRYTFYNMTLKAGDRTLNTVGEILQLGSIFPAAGVIKLSELASGFLV